MLRSSTLLRGGRAGGRERATATQERECGAAVGGAAGATRLAPRLLHDQGAEEDEAAHRWQEGGEGCERVVPVPQLLRKTQTQQNGARKSEKRRRAGSRI